ncbi:MAG TPA: SDR family oxidoreductase [Polyangium sp.]|nr:SDR family oxidoreductase [Polyangium sp.]
MNHKPNVIIISGGSRGLGQTLVSTFLAEGHIVATFSRTPTSFIDELQQNDPNGDTFYWQAVDATALDDVKKFALSVFRRYGRIDTLINNAGIGVDGLLTLMRASDIQRGITVNLAAAIQLTQTCFKCMLEQQSGSIVNITSVNGIRGHAGVSVYSATKSALDGMTRSLAKEVGPKGIRVNSVAPGYFESDMTSDFTDAQRATIARRTPLQRLGTSEEIANVVRFLISPQASFVTGQILAVDGGYSC